MYHIIDLRTRHIEAFEQEYNNIPQDLHGRLTSFAFVLRAAASAGWFANLTADQVGELPVSETIRLAELVNVTYTKTMAPPSPN